MNPIFKFIRYLPSIGNYGDIKKLEIIWALTVISKFAQKNTDLYTEQDFSLKNTTSQKTEDFHFHAGLIGYKLAKCNSM